MGRGFLAGIFWGAIVGFAILFVSAQITVRHELSFPQPEATPVEVPAGTEFDQARPETDPVVPEPETRPDPDALTGVTPPADAVEAPPSFDTTALEVPTPAVEGPESLGETPPVAEGVRIEVAEPATADTGGEVPQPELVSPEAPAPAPDATTEGPAPDVTAPADEDDVALLAPAPETSPASEAAPTPSVTVEAPPTPPVTGDEIAAPVAPQTLESPERAPAPDTDSDTAPNLIVRADGSDSQFFRPVDDIGNLATGVETDRLPRIGDAPETEEAALPVVRRPQATETDEEPLDLPSDDDPLPENAAALLKWRMPFENPEDRPLLSIVLIHEGDEALAAEDLAGLPATVAFGVDAGQPGAAEIAAAYRARGREVVMIPSLPAGATPQDVEVALRVNFETVPEAVAVMDSSGESFQSDRAAVAQVVDVVTATGHGLITFPRGLNTAYQRAERAGVPTGLIFRDIDGKNQTNEQIRRALDRAAFRARQKEAVILVGRTRPATVAALIEWALGNRAASVALAPVSAALLDG